jgi:serine/threonine-protein kinase
MPPLLPSRPGPDIPPGFAEVIARGMAENPRDRYGSARELVDAAQRALTSARADVPSSRLTTPAAAIFAGDTQTVQRGSTPAGSRPGPPPWDPGYGGSPTVTYPQSRPLPLPVGRPGQRHRIAAVVFAVAVVVAVVAGAAIAIPRLTGHTTTAPTPHTYTTEPAVLPFPGLDLPMSAAVDSSGALYVLASWAAASGEHDNAGHRLVVLPKAATSTTMKDLPGIDVRSATDVATDTAGNLYVSQDKSVWELAAGASRPIRLPFRGFVTIEAITVDPAGNIYAAGSVSTGGSTVKYAIRKLAPGDNKPTELPFTDLHLPRAVAVDKAGNVYVGDTIRGTGKGRIRRLAANTETPTSLSFPGLLEATRFAVDAAGELFVADAWQKKAGLFKLPAGSTTAAKVSISLRASAVAVDSGDNLYIATSATKDRNERIATPGQVVKLAPDR